MADHLLRGVVEKLRRADIHLASLYGETIEYSNSAGHGLIPKQDAGNGHPGLVYQVTKEPPPHFPALIGDILHNERCALDYLAHALVIVSGNTPTERTQFPIFRMEGGFLKELDSPDRTKGIAPWPMRVLGVFQPYQLDESKRMQHPLWILRVLSNLDKHRQPTVSAMGTRCIWSYRDSSGVRRTGSTLGMVYDGAVLAEFPAIDQVHAELKFKGSRTVAFRDPPADGLEAINVLASIREYIGDFMLPIFLGDAKIFEPLPDHLKLEVCKLTELATPIEPLNLD